MPAITIHKLSEETHRALQRRAAQHNRSTEAEIRAILEAAAHPEERIRIGSALSAISKKLHLTNSDVESLENATNSQPAHPLRIK
jgi:plasmid stability protein